MTIIEASPEHIVETTTWMLKVLNERGWYQGGLVALQGSNTCGTQLLSPHKAPVCFIGAINVAVQHNVHATPFFNSDVEMHVAESYRLLFETYLRQEGDPWCDCCGLDDDGLANWNDDNNRDEEEIIALIEKVRDDWL